jgi:hypothetical protein
MLRDLVLGAVVGLVAGGAAAQEVDLELVLLADASGSIDEAEIRFQREGWAAAITAPEILDAIRVGYAGKIAVTYVEWGTAGSQAVIVPWTIVDGPVPAAAFAEALRREPRRAFGSNAIGSAIAFAQTLLEGNGIAGQRRVIDLAGDSANSWSGVPLASAREAALAAGITINGLALSCPALGCGGRPVSYDLEAAFARTIIGGPASVVVTADGATSFADAARRKLLLEIAGTAAFHPVGIAAGIEPEERPGRSRGGAATKKSAGRARPNSKDQGGRTITDVGGKGSRRAPTDRRANARAGELLHLEHGRRSKTPCSVDQVARL